MKPIVAVSLVSLLLGGLFGTVIPRYLPLSDTNAVAALRDDAIVKGLEEDTAADVSGLEEENAALLKKIADLKLQLERIKQEVATGEQAVLMQEYQPSEAQLRRLKKDWIANALAVSDPRMQRRTERELSELIHKLGLTPEQATEMGLLYDKRNQQQQLQMMRMMGLVSEEEYSAMFAELEAFDFKLAADSILSPDQQKSLDSLESEQREQGIQRMSLVVADRLKLNEEGRFSDTERTAINNAITLAMDREAILDVPPAIRDLQINRADKRILAAGFQELDGAAFEKLYESVVELNQNGESVFGGGGRGGRGGGRPPGN